MEKKKKKKKKKKNTKHPIMQDFIYVIIKEKPHYIYINHIL